MVSDYILLKEHCLMGIKGTVRRSTDGHIIHANIDTDVIIAEEPPYGQCYNFTIESHRSCTCIIYYVIHSFLCIRQLCGVTTTNL